MMKRIFKYMLLLPLLCWAGCGDEGDKLIELTGESAQMVISSGSDNVTISGGGESASVLFKAKGGFAQINIESNIVSDWNIEMSENANWLGIEKSPLGLRIMTWANTGDTNNAKLTITAGEGDNKASVTIDVKQLGINDPDLTLSVKEVLFTPDDLEPKLVTVTTNQEEWTFRTRTPSDWLLIDQTSEGLVLTPDMNPYFGNLTIEIEVIAGIGDKTVTEVISVKNEAMAYITLEPNPVTFTQEGGTAFVAVLSNQQWELKPISEWWVNAKIEDNKIKVETEPNTDLKDRKYEIEIVCGTGDNTMTITLLVEQWGMEVDHIVLEYTLTGAATVYLPIVGTIDASIMWGDGNTSLANAQYPSHKYTEAGVYEVHISGTVTGMNSENAAAGSAKYITKVKKWGHTGLTSMRGALEGCANLVSIPGDDANSFAEVTTFESAFRGNLSLLEIPSNLLVSATKVTRCDYMFSAGYNVSSVLSAIPAGLFDACTEVENFGSVFYGNILIESVPKGLFDKNTKATSFSEAFMGCKGLVTVPGGLFAKCPEVTTFLSTFASCESLKSVPADIFEGCTKVTDLGYLFQYCKSLGAVPAGIFDDMTEVKNIFAMFQGCETIKSVPAGLFSKMTPAANAGSLFSGCIGLETIPAGLFDTFSGITGLSNLFLNCSSLTAAPAGLFKHCTSATNIQQIFKGCSSLASVGEELFNCPAATGNNNTRYIFQDCVSLKTIPADLLSSLSKATRLTGIFRGCTNLDAVPAGLFDNCSSAIWFNEMFNDCVSLRSVPAALFEKNTKAVNFSNAFKGCTSLGGESPFSTVSEVKVHLYEREPANGFTKPTTTAACFNGCTGLSDYDNIPVGWK